MLFCCGMSGNSVKVRKKAKYGEHCSWKVARESCLAFMPSAEKKAAVEAV